jgi:hypothetical protein
MIVWYGSGCGSGRPKNIWILEIRTRNTGTFTVHHSSKMKSHEENHKNSTNQGFSYYFCLMMGGSGSVLVTYGSGKPKNKQILRVRIRIRNTDRCEVIILEAEGRLFFDSSVTAQLFIKKFKRVLFGVADLDPE